MYICIYIYVCVYMPLFLVRQIFIELENIFSEPFCVSIVIIMLAIILE